MPDFKGLVKKAFPFISAAAAFGGPLGTLAANAVGKAVGATNLDPTPGGLAAAIAGATPEQLQQLRQAEADTQARLQQMGFTHVEELEKLSVEDRESARARQIAVKDRVPGVLAIGITIGFFGVLGVVSFHGFKEQSRDLMNIMLGSLGTAWVSVVTYYFGSSAGSDRKTELMATSKTGG
jgi:hypothetical protein